MMSEYNAPGIYLIKFYIRGKQWLVQVDDQVLVDASDALQFAQKSSKFSTTGNYIWVSILEKAWIKVLGNYNSYKS